MESVSPTSSPVSYTSLSAEKSSSTSTSDEVALQGFSTIAGADPQDPKIPSWESLGLPKTGNKFLEPSQGSQVTALLLKIAAEHKEISAALFAATENQLNTLVALNSVKMEAIDQKAEADIANAKAAIAASAISIIAGLSVFAGNIYLDRQQTRPNRDQTPAAEVVAPQENSAHENNRQRSDSVSVDHKDVKLELEEFKIVSTSPSGTTPTSQKVKISSMQESPIEMKNNPMQEPSTLTVKSTQDNSEPVQKSRLAIRSVTTPSSSPSSPPNSPSKTEPASTTHPTSVTNNATRGDEEQNGAAAHAAPRANDPVPAGQNNDQTKRMGLNTLHEVLNKTGEIARQSVSIESTVEKADAEKILTAVDTLEKIMNIVTQGLVADSKEVTEDFKSLLQTAKGLIKDEKDTSGSLFKA